MSISRLPNPEIEIRIKGMGSYYLPAGISISEMLKRINIQNKYPVMGAIIDNNLCDLQQIADSSCELELVDLSSEIGVRINTRTLVFILVKASREILPDRKLIIKHSLSNGLYCEFLDYNCNEEDIKVIQERMLQIVQANRSITRKVVSKEEARRIFSRQGQLDTVKLLEYRNKEDVNISELDGIYEYFYGYMLPETGMVSQFRLLHYHTGLVLQSPEAKAPGELHPYVEQRKLAAVFQEAKDWVEMLDTPHVAALNDIIIKGNIGDLIRVNEALHEKKIASIADQICNNTKTRLVLIAGPSSSGKTTFAQRLMIQLRVNGRRPVSISLDNYFVDRCLTPLDQNNEHDFESLHALKIELFNQHLLSLINGEEVEIPSYSFHAGCCVEMGIKVKVPRGELIIIEGIHGLNDKLTWCIPSEQKFKIYISALTQLNIDYNNRIPTTDSRLIRRILRDSRTRGYSALETISRWPSVRRGEEDNIFPFQENADVMFNSSLVYELGVLKPMVEPLLAQIGAQSREHVEARRLLKFVSYFRPIDSFDVPPNSILREFIGGSCFK
ncbi:MAG: nucleoside kinase [Syntrophomonadaceae bacterium]|nr:nucleoside kinase [Syntrophomonadaceae bacterium]MDD3022766.1 nucleoside kinase [Syntrophomonadaceae bacterium]